MLPRRFQGACNGTPCRRSRPRGADPELALGGHVIEKLAEFATVPPEIRQTIIAASSQAFVAGMDRAIWVASFALIGTAVVSYVLVSDSVVKAHLTEPEPAALPVEKVLAAD